MSDDRNIGWNAVWIIGASSGIGREIALQIAPHCNELYISARSREALEEIAALKPNAVCMTLDVTDRQAVTTAANKISRLNSNLDLVVVCSGIWKKTDIANLDPDDFRATMETNYLGAVNIISAVTPNMVKNGSGHIALVSSVAGYRGLPNAASYAPTKAALINLAECLKPQFARLGVTISIVNPGFVETRLTAVNSFSMPFIQSAQVAAQHILAGLKKKKYEIAFPLQFVLILKLLRAMPNRMFFWLVDRFVLR